MTKLFLTSFVLTICISCSDKSYFIGKKNNTEMLVGFVLLNSGDTLQGSIIDQDHHASHISFINSSGSTFIYEPIQIQGYVVRGKFFKSLKFECGTTKKPYTAYAFGEELTKGKLVLYKTQLKTDALLPATEAYMVEKENNAILYPAGSIYNLIEVVKDDVSLTNRIKNHEFKDNDKNRLAIVNEYNSTH
jgi:hypothetical protein